MAGSSGLDGRRSRVGDSRRPDRTKEPSALGKRGDFVDRELEGMADREPDPEENDASFQDLIEGLEDIGLALLDASGRVRSWNAAATRITGHDASEMVGRPIDSLPVPTGDAREGGQAASGPAVLTSGATESDPGWRSRPDGSRYRAEVKKTPLPGPAGVPRGFAWSIRELDDEESRDDHRSRRLEDELRRSGDASRRKDELLSLLAHQLRNPLAPIRNGLHLLKRGGDDPRLSIEIYELMDRQVDRLARIVDDVLEVSRLSRGLIVLEPQHVDLRQVGRQALEARRPEADRLGLSMVVVTPPAPVWVRAEAVRLRQVVEALLENAIRHTGRSGSITLEIVADAAHPCSLMIVRDTGAGIAKENLHKLSEALASSEGSLDRSRGGLGIGLALARGIVELHGGTIRVESEGNGRGASFTVELPIAGPDPALRSNPSPPFAPNAERLSILVVEDNADAAESLKRLLRLHGHEVRVADNGVDGVAEAKRCHPDAVVCDIGLPGMDGYAVATALRGDPETARARLIAVTGYGRAEDRARALSSGFDDHITKPADPEVLLRKLVIAVGRS